MNENVATPDKFRKLADAMQKQINNKMADRLANTPKRQRDGGYQRQEGEHLIRTQAALRALADCHEAGAVPECLTSLKSKKAVHELTAGRIEGNQGYYDCGFDTGEPRQDTEQTRALWPMLKPKSEAEKQAEDLARRVDDLQFSQIPGYYPTPKALVELMIEKADIHMGLRVLEPSAGHGSIVDGLQGLYVDVDACELNHTLAQILKDKGIKVVGDDFMLYLNEVKYDRVLMNPPFEKGQDVEHVTRAYDMLRHLGRLVAIMSPGWTFRTGPKAEAFRALVEECGTWETLPDGSFKDSGTGTSAVIVTLDCDV